LSIVKTFAISCAAVLAFAACGSGGGTHTLTKSEYDAKLSHLCLLAADQFRELHLDNTIASWKHGAPEILRIDRTFAHKLAALKPPSSIAAAVADYTKASAKRAQDDKAAIAAAKAGDAAKLRAAMTQGGRDDHATFPSAKAIGARGCYF
jgi:hypothetical protein